MVWGWLRKLENGTMKSRVWLSSIGGAVMHNRASASWLSHHSNARISFGHEGHSTCRELHRDMRCIFASILKLRSDQGDRHSLFPQRSEMMVPTRIQTLRAVVSPTSRKCCTLWLLQTYITKVWYTFNKDSPPYWSFDPLTSSTPFEWWRISNLPPNIQKRTGCFDVDGFWMALRGDNHVQEKTILGEEQIKKFISPTVPAPKGFEINGRCLPDIDDPECPHVWKKMPRSERCGDNKMNGRSDKIYSAHISGIQMIGVVANWFGKGVMNSIKLVDK